MVIEPVAGSDVAVRAEEQLAIDVVSVAGELGWELQLSDLVSGQSLSVGDGAEYGEARFERRGTTGQVVVGITTGMSSASVANEMSRRAGPFAVVGDARIYVATDSGAVRAVELFEGTTLVYVESQLRPQAKSLDELQSLAISVADAWPGHNVTVDPTITAAVPLEIAGP